MEEKRYRHYTADSFYCIMKCLGLSQIKSYSEICAPKDEEEKSPSEIARERAAKMGLKAVDE